MTPIGSILIPAHDEERVITRTLDHLGGIAEQGLVEVIVICNGCQDQTANLAREFPGVQVREIEQPSKTAALREGEQIASPGPHLYLDADVEMTARAAVATLRALSEGAIAARPPRQFDTSGAHELVRRWYVVRERLPSLFRTLWGAGCYGLSVEGRARFGAFPEVVADDLFIDSLFDADEVTIVATDAVVVHTPLRPADLLLILRRHYRTQETAPPASTSWAVSAGQRRQLADLRALLRHDPSRIWDVLVYVSVVVVARLRARVGPSPRWERDMSSRLGTR